MRLSQNTHIRTPLRYSPAVILIGFVGIIIAGAIGKYAPETPFSQIAFSISCISTVVGFVVLLPLELIFTKSPPAEPPIDVPLSSLPLHERALAVLAFGQIPKLIYWPILGIAYLLGSCVLAITVLAIAAMIWSLVHSSIL
jgi:hypothetical protein